MSGTIFFICFTSAISALSAALRFSAWPAAPERWRKGRKNKKETTRSWQSQSRRQWTWPSVWLRRRVRGYSKHPVGKIGQVQGNATRHKKTKNTWISLKIRQAQGNLSLQDIRDIQELQETQETRKPKAMTKIGHTISIFHQIMCCTWRRSSRSWDKDMVAIRRIKWKTSMWTQRYGVCLCLSLFKLQFTSGKITWNLWNSYFKSLESWSLTKLKLLDWPRLTGSSPCLRLFWLSAMSGRYQKQSVGKQEKMVFGNTLSQRLGSDRRCNFPRIHYFGEFSTRFKRWWLNQSVNQSTSMERSSSVKMYNDIDWTRQGNKENCFANAPRVTEYARRFTQGRWSFPGPGSEKKWYGSHAHKLDGDWDKTAESMMLNFAESGHPVFVPAAPLCVKN